MSRPIRDESGVAMGLAVILIVIIGVMGAGLLVFVRNDLQAVVEVNQGQRAFEVADAGVQAAGQQLDNPDEMSSEWSSGDGMEIEGLYGDEGTATVQIQSSGDTHTVTSKGEYRNATRQVRATFEATGGGEAEIPQMVYSARSASANDFSLEGMGMYSDRDISLTQDYISLQNASMFADGDIRLNIQNGAKIVVDPQNGTQYNCDNVGSDRLRTEGTDPYGDWEDGTYNDTPRQTDVSGIGATGTIRDSSQPNKNRPCELGTQFFDSTTKEFPYSEQEADFVDPPDDPQPSDQITFPFKQDPSLGNLTSSLKGAAIAQGENPDIPKYKIPAGEVSTDIDDMTDNSKGNYIEIEGGGVNTVRFCHPDEDCSHEANMLDLYWPKVDAGTPASEWPVVYVKFMNNSVNNTVLLQMDPQSNVQDSGQYPAERCKQARESSPDPRLRGVLVADDGKIKVDGEIAPLAGGLISTSSQKAENRDITGPNGDLLCVEGPVMAEGNIDYDNDTGFKALNPTDYKDLPGFGGSSGPARMDSWRECYSEDC